MDYMIRGHLAGPLLTSEQVIASELFIPLDYDNHTLVGAVHAHGTAIAGRQVGILSSELKLRRASR